VYRDGYDNPAKYLQDVLTNCYWRDYWNTQPYNVEVWSEKSTVGGVLHPVLSQWGVNFRNLRGYTSATNAHDLAIRTKHSRKPFVALYVGDWDPSGLHMSEVDLPRRLGEYGGVVELRRVALTLDHTMLGEGLALEGKQKDTRHQWYVSRYQVNRFWELDGLDPRLLRDEVEHAIRSLVDPEAWDRCMTIEQAERESLEGIFSSLRKQAHVLFGLNS
jgi:hypothetical protein